jgi:hypothetical protein
MLVDETAEQVASTNGPGVGGARRLAVQAIRSGQGESPVWALPVVVLDVHAEHPLQVSPAEDEHPIQALDPDGSDPSLGEGVGPGSSDGRADHLDSVGAEHLVEARDLLRVSVTDQEPKGSLVIDDVPGQVPGLLGDPGRVWVGGHSRQVHSPGL